ncbi:YheC/YheD family protein [Bacillus carboniphilus]|uniref:YheC/YheD family protein n=1 Tax=Bacillus carboniphilus TaxID=86663 RepID=A0ABY9JTR4_9BACI|nr:YheC/YheD family protein [Bacillus carboniphilus]WLR42802.1 YheC/YheD family protein [Bacillus carboniphilus]
MRLIDKKSIAILTSKNENQTKYRGNIRLFKQLQKKLSTYVTPSFLFCIDDVTVNGIYGLYYDPTENKWTTYFFVNPIVIYNRIPSREEEQETYHHQNYTLLKNKDVPIINPCFFNKWKIDQMLRKQKNIEKILPDTIFLDHESSLFSFLDKYRSIYVKPVDGSQGDHIFSIIKERTSFLLIDSLGQTQTLSFQQLNRYISNLIKQQSFICQETVPCKKHKEEKLDLRTLVHLSSNNQYKLTGIGFRQSTNRSITTHVMKGGENSIV